MKWKFPVFLGLAMIFGQLLLMLFIQAMAGPERTWLGDYVWNSSDQAVYFTYIEQAKRGALVFHGLFTPIDGGWFTHPVYAPIGWLAALFNLSAIHAHELGKSVAILIAIVLLYCVARRMTKDEYEARIATLTVTLGGGIGWILVVIQGMRGYFPPGFFVPDVASEIFFFPTLLGGAHIPLSLALLVYSLNRIWVDILEAQEKARPSWQSLLSTAALFFVHPYFVCIVGPYTLFALLFKRFSWRDILRFGLPYLPLGLLALSPYLWSYWHDPYRRFLLTDNVLELATPLQNLFSVMPWLIFIAWRCRRTPFRREEQWIFVWILTVFLLLCFPLIHFKRKMMEGLGVGVILLALPVWLRIITWAKQTGRMANIGIWVLITLSPFSLIQSQLLWVTRPMGKGNEFYASQDVVHMWQWIRTYTKPTDIILTDDSWVALWLAPNTLRHVWIAHDHETPEFFKRRELLRQILQTRDKERVQALFNQIDAQVLVTSTKENGIFIQDYATSTWKHVNQFRMNRIWQRKDQ